MILKNRKSLITRFALIFALLGATVGAASSERVSAAPGNTTLVSPGSIPSPLGVNNGSYRPSLSADGRYVAFYSNATNLVSHDTNAKSDIFVFDRQTSLVERVSVDSDGAQANGDSYASTMSMDGRYVAFVSDATNLVSNDTNGGKDVFFHDRQTKLTERISAAPYPGGTDSPYIPPSISADGRYVAFGSAASTLVSGDVNGMEDIFVFDRQTGVTERVSVGLDGVEANDGSYAPSISADGRYVTFDSWADNLVSGDMNDVDDIFVYDRQTGITERVSVDSSGAEANSHSDWPSISGDGRYVAFGSESTNLVSGDTNGDDDVFVHDRQTGVTERVSVSSSGAEGDRNSYAPSISGDGRYVAFASYASTLVSDDTNNTWDIFVHDRQTGVTERVSVDSSGVEGNDQSNAPAISGDGRSVAFESYADNLVNGDVNFRSDIFMRDLQTNETELVSMGPVILGANQNSYDPSISADGRFVSFVSVATNLVADDTNRKTDVFLYDRQAGVTERVSVDSNGVQTNDTSSAPVISADGRYVTFMSLGTNLVDDDTNAKTDIFVHDRQTGVTERVSVDSSGAQANNTSQFPAISGDGRYVVFESYATNLVSSDTVTADIFIHDRQTGVTERISTAPGGVLSNNGSYTPDISADGRYVVFRSAASNLVAGDTNGKSDIFLYDRQLGFMERVSVDSNGGQANDGSYSPSISADGRYLAFQSAASNLVSDDTNGVDDIFVHDRQTGVTRRVSVDSNGVAANAKSDSPSISGDGRYVAFTSDASNLVGNDTNNTQDIFVHGHLTGVTKRVSIDSSEVQANGSSGAPSLSENGQFVAFTSGASNLVNEDQNYFYDVFVHENDILARVASIVRADADPTYAVRVDFTVTFSEPVTGVDAGDFSLHVATGNILNPTITNVIADDPCASYCATYVVTVDTGVGNGTLRLDLPAAASVTDLSGNPLGNLPFAAGEAYTIKKPASIDVAIHGNLQGTYSVTPGASTRQSYHEVNNGPVKIAGTNHIPLIPAERVIYRVNGVYTSFSEMMALPASQLDTTYWLPWYNNVDLDTQLRFANVSALPATVRVFIGTSEVGVFTLQAGESMRQSFPAINNGPVKIISDQDIVAAERLIYQANKVNTSFSEMMALPNSQLDTTYWLPWYNNVDLDTQLRFGNVSDSVATIHVYIAGEEMTGSPFTLAPRAGVRKSLAGVNKGPVRIESDVPIVAAERVIYKVNGVNTSFSEMMALPNSQLDTTYWLPWYNNVDLDTQLRVANISTTQQATVRVYIGEQEVMGSPFKLDPGRSIRQSFSGINHGPVKVESNTPIVVAERVIYKVNEIPASFSEMMGLSNSQLDLTYWLPWYNNVGLDSQLRFGIP